MAGPLIWSRFQNMDTLSQYINKTKDFHSMDDFQSWVMMHGNNLRSAPNIRENRSCGCGCNMNIWIRGHKDGMDRWVFEGDSDTQYNKGITKIVIDCFTGLTTEQVKSYNFRSFRPIARATAFDTQRGIQCLINQIHKIVDS